MHAPARYSARYMPTVYYNILFTHTSVYIITRRNGKSFLRCIFNLNQFSLACTLLYTRRTTGKQWWCGGDSGGVGGVGASYMQASAQSVPYYFARAPIPVCSLPPRLSAATDAADIIPIVPSI